MSEIAVPLVRIRLMGPLLVEHTSGRQGTFRYEKLRALLAYLSSQPDQAHPRAELAQLLWPGGTVEAAQGNLRRALFDLRQFFDALGVTCPFHADRRVVQWRGAAEVHVQRPQDADPASPALFLEDLRVDDSPAWQRWLQAQRERIQLARLTRLDDQVRRCERRGDWASAVALAEQRVRIHPDDEEGHRRLIRLLMQHGQLERADAAYRACQAHARRLGAPSLEASTQALGQALQEASMRPTHTLSRAPITLLVIHLSAPPHSDPDTPDPTARPQGSHTPSHALGGQLSKLSERLLVLSFGGLTPQEHTPQRAWEALRRKVAQDAGRSSHRWQAAIAHVETRLAPGYPTPDASGEALSEALALLFGTPPGQLGLNAAARLMLRRDLPRSCLAPDRTTHPLADLPALRVNASLCPWLSDAETPPVGRQHELSQLLDWCAQAHDQAPHRLHLEAEAGMGKTRLLRHLASRVLDRGSRLLLIQADPLHQHHPWHALKQAVQERLRDAAHHPDSWRIKRLRRAFGAALPETSRGWASLTRLLGLPSPLDDPGLSADTHRRHLEQGLFELLRLWCGPRPLLIIIEDTHWLDEATWHSAVQLCDQPGWPHNWKLLSSARTGEGMGPTPRQMELTALSASATTELARQLAQLAGVEIDDEETAALASQAEGVPLFLDQLIHARQGPHADHIHSAPSLRELLLTRMRRLGPHLELAQVAACTGRTIDMTLLTHQQQAPMSALMIGLEALQRAGMVQGSGTNWVFRHALIQAAALASMTPRLRQQVHQQLADIMRSRAPERIKEAPEQLAQHLHEAGSPDACAAWLAAARHFSRRSETAAARHHLQQGLQALNWLHDEATRQDMAFRLWVETGHTLVALEGYGSEGSRRAYATALALADRVSDEGDLFQLMWGMWLGSRTVDEQAPPMAFAERLERAARDSSDPGVRLQVHYAFGNNHFWLAQYRSARQRLESAVALSTQVDSQQMIALYGEASHVCALAFLSWIDWLEGDTDKALSRSAQAVAQGRRSGHAHTLCFALAFSATLNRYLDRAEEAAQQAATLAALASEQRLVLWQATAAAVAGWAQARRGDPAGLAPIRAGLAGAKQAMAAVETTFQAFLADALVHLGQWDEALRVIDEGLRTAHAIPDTYLLAELMRLRAHALLALNPQDTSACQASLQAGLAIASEQGAVALTRKLELSRSLLLG